MAVQAPAHRQRCHLTHHLHSVHPTVTGNTPHTPDYVSRMIEVHVVGEVVYSHPRHRHARGVAFPYRHQLGTGGAHSSVTVHTSLRGRNGCFCRHLHSVMAVPAIQAQLSHVQSVAKGKRLFRGIAHIGGLRRASETYQNYQINWSQNQRRSQELPQLGSPSGKDKTSRGSFHNQGGCCQNGKLLSRVLSMRLNNITDVAS